MSMSAAILLLVLQIVTVQADNRDREHAIERRSTAVYHDFTQAQKKLILDKHNELRRIVNPPASDMRKMSWDNGLEKLATDYSRKCIYDHNKARSLDGFRYVGENLHISYGHTIDDEYAPKGVESWDREKNYYNYETRGCTDVCGHYTQVAWADSYLLGCGMTTCPMVDVGDGKIWRDATLLVCNYAPGGNIRGQKPYTEGSFCTKCNADEQCDNKLCSNSLQEEKTTTTNPQPGTTTTEPQLPDTGVRHTFSDVQKKLIVDKHNELRRIVHPPAKNMLKMSWNNSLEELATDYSRNCIYKHDKAISLTGFFRVGENLHVSYGHTIDDNYAPKAVEEWDSEKSDYNFSTGVCTPFKKCRHYTQVVWSNSYLVGCGMTTCPTIIVGGKVRYDATLLVCNYAPGGNYVGEKPYEDGTPCSECNEGDHCEDNLCSNKLRNSGDAPRTGHGFWTLLSVAIPLIWV